MANTLPPLSSTVTNVFDAFLKELEDKKVLEIASIKALKESLSLQKFEHGSLRTAMFTPSPPTESAK